MDSRSIDSCVYCLSVSLLSVPFLSPYLLSLAIPCHLSPPVNVRTFQRKPVGDYETVSCCRKVQYSLVSEKCSNLNSRGTHARLRSVLILNLYAGQKKCDRKWERKHFKTTQRSHIFLYGQFISVTWEHHITTINITHVTRSRLCVLDFHLVFTWIGIFTLQVSFTGKASLEIYEIQIHNEEKKKETRNRLPSVLLKGHRL